MASARTALIIGGGIGGLSAALALRRAGYWGQLLLVMTGVGLTLAGVTIAAIGATTVFVPEDLGFMQTTREMLSAINSRIIPLIPHDRASFSGALLADGLAVLLTALWGYRRGARWIWWMLLGAGIPGFAAGLGTHVSVGYLDIWHLAPALAALVIYVLGLCLTYPHLCAPLPEIDDVRQPGSHLPLQLPQSDTTLAPASPTHEADPPGSDRSAAPEHRA